MTHFLSHYRHWQVVLTSFALLSACSSPTGPTETLVTLSGTVTATNGGQPLAAVIDVGGQHLSTDISGRYRLELASGRYSAMISGAGLVPRTLSIDASTSREQPLDAIAEQGFDLGFYRQFVRNGLDGTALEPIRRWTVAPLFTLQVVDSGGIAVDPAVLTTTQRVITEMIPLWSGGRFAASFGTGGVPVRFSRDVGDGRCGQASIGPVAAYLEIRLVAVQFFGCDLSQAVAHETGHLMGFWHTDGASDLMRTRGTALSPSARERAHAAIAYQRAVGNRDLDND